MEWKIAADAPIYQQLSRQIRLGIVSGEYAPESGCRRCASWRSRRG